MISEMALGQIIVPLRASIKAFLKVVFTQGVAPARQELHYSAAFPDLQLWFKWNAGREESGKEERN